MAGQCGGLVEYCQLHSCVSIGEYLPFYPLKLTVHYSMVAAAHFTVDYKATTQNTRVKQVEPIMTFAGPPPDQYQPAAVGFAGQLNGINQMVCTYLPSNLVACTYG